MSRLCFTDRGRQDTDPQAARTPCSSEVSGVGDGSSNQELLRAARTGQAFHAEVGAPDDPAEREADEAASMVMSGQPVRRSVTPADPAADWMRTPEREAAPRVSGDVSNTPGVPGDQSNSQKTRPPLAVPSLQGAIEPQLVVGLINDPLEHDSDRVAEQALAVPAYPAVSGTPRQIQGISEQPTGQPVAAPASVDDALASPGTPLEPTLRQDMEQRFGHDFSRLRVHTDAKAAESADAVSARAYTVGHHIVFAEGQSFSDRALLAHELAHVVQQSEPTASTTVRRAPVRGPQPPAPPRESLEVIAQRIARQAFGPQQDFGDFPLGPVLSVVRDDVSGRTFVALNTGISRQLTDLLNQRLLARIRAISTGQIELIRNIVPGGHAEVVALNEAIAAREALTQRLVTSQDLPTFELHNVWLQDKRQFETAARCEHCAELTEGVRLTRSLYIAENPVSATSPPGRHGKWHHHHRRTGPGRKAATEGIASREGDQPACLRVICC